MSLGIRVWPGRAITSVPSGVDKLARGADALTIHQDRPSCTGLSFARCPDRLGLQEHRRSKRRLRRRKNQEDDEAGAQAGAAPQAWAPERKASRM